MPRVLICLLSLCIAGLAESKPNENKVLIPVVVTDPAGQPVTDLQMPNFSVQAAKNLRLDSAELVAPSVFNDPQHSVPVYVFYDVMLFNQDQQRANGTDLLEFLGEVAAQRLPVSLVLSTAKGLHLVYDFSTDPKVLADALAALNSRSDPTDPKVKEQLQRLKLLQTYIPAVVTHEESVPIEFIGLERMGQLLKRSPNRKSLIWMTWMYPLGTGEDTTKWVPLYDTLPDTANRDQRVAGGSDLVDMTETPWLTIPPLPQYQKSIDALNEAHVSVYPLQMVDRRKNSATRMDTFTAAGLKQVALCTGGTSSKDFRTTTISQAVKGLRNDIGPYYMLTIAAADIKKTEWVPLKVKVDKPGVTVRAAPGFLGLSPKDAAKVAGQH